MEIKTGYLYHIKDEYFDKINDKELMINHKNGHSRLSYLAINDNDILWFIPLSSRIDKYQLIVDKKIEKYGKCNGIMIEKISGEKQAILIQNAFPTLPKYIKSIHVRNGRKIKVSVSLQKKIIDNFEYLITRKKNGTNLFFTDIDRIKSMMLNELKEDMLLRI